MLYRTILQATQLNTQNETTTNPICGQGVFVVNVSDTISLVRRHW